MTGERTRPVTPALRQGDLRPVHYIGNKSRYLDAIEREIARVAEPGALACDLFAGTAVVSRRLAYRGPVLSADVQSYSSVFAQALTRPVTHSTLEIESILGCARGWIESQADRVTELLEYEAEAHAQAEHDPTQLVGIVEHGSIAVRDVGPRGLDSAKSAARSRLRSDREVMTWYYGGVYFSYAQALALDGLRYAVRELGQNHTALAALLGTASDAVSTVGNHFAQPMRPRTRAGELKTSPINAMLRRRNFSILEGFASWLEKYAELRPTPFECIPRHADFRETLSELKGDIGVVYADPPYTRDHYSRFYHVLETIALDDDPGVTAGPGGRGPARGLYRAERHQSPFSIRSQAKGAFVELISGAAALCAPLVISYSPMGGGTRARAETRLISVSDIAGMAAQLYPRVEVIEIPESAHSKFNKRELNSLQKGSAESLIIAHF